MIIQLLFLCLILVLIFLYLNGKYNEKYWKKRGVTFHKKNNVFGPIWEFLTKDTALFEVFNDLYKQYPNEPAIGIGNFTTPTLYVIDPINMQHVLQQDFNSFHHRGIEPIDGDQLSDNILFMNGPRWKLMRQNMTPLFSAVKLKSMYYVIDKSASDFVEFLKNNPKRRKDQVFNTMSTFCSAAIGAAVFGIGSESMFDSPFLDMAQKSNAPTFVRQLKFSLAHMSFPIFKALGLNFFKEFEDFFIGAIRQVIEKREEENVKRNDFADICINLQKNGKMKDQNTGCELEPTVGLLAAQAFFFFIAGVEPTATVLYCTLMELGRNPEVLKNIHEEIDAAFDKNSNQMSYDVVNEMDLLDNVLSESMRMYPPIGFLTRLCVQDTVLPVGNIKVSKGTKIFTPIFEIHHDEKYYPNPDIFDPERFSHDSNKPLKDLAYMPFGKGNRICIGARYARLQIKAGLVHLFKHFTVKTLVDGDKILFKKEALNVRPKNVDVELIPRI